MKWKYFYLNRVALSVFTNVKKLLSLEALRDFKKKDYYTFKTLN